MLRTERKSDFSPPDLNYDAEYNALDAVSTKDITDSEIQQVFGRIHVASAIARNLSLKTRSASCGRCPQN